MTWNDFLATVRRLLTEQTEADWRSAVSRAYYAVFHFFRVWLNGKGIRLEADATAHSTLKYWLQNCGIDPVKRIGQQVDALRTKRNDADYRFERRLSKQKASDSVSQADQIVTNFQIIPPTELDSAVSKIKQLQGQ